MKRLIKNGDVVLDGTKTRAEKEKEAFEQLEMLYKFVEILKEKKVNIADELYNVDYDTKQWVFDSYENYLQSVKMIPIKYHLTKEEHNLLKGVLLDEIH